MARPVSPRDPGEHHTLLARVLRQVTADTRLNAKRKFALSSYISSAMRVLEIEMNARSKPKVPR